MSKTNKTQAVRALLESQPDISPREAVEEMKSQGIDISSAFFSNCKTKWRAEQGTVATRKQVKKRKAPAKKRAATNGHSKNPSVELFEKTLEFIEAAGSSEKAVKVIEFVGEFAGK